MRGNTGHTEAVFDPTKVSYEDVLRSFFRPHDPTTMNRPGNDVGSQYRSAICYHDDKQRKTAERVRAEVNASGESKNPVVTQVVPAGPFWKAEDYHQDYLQKHPNGYTCHWLRDGPGRGAPTPGVPKTCSPAFPTTCRRSSPIPGPAPVRPRCR